MNEVWGPSQLRGFSPIPTAGQDLQGGNGWPWLVMVAAVIFNDQLVGGLKHVLFLHVLEINGHNHPN